jgi:hypothetical protein
MHTTRPAPLALTLALGAAALTLSIATRAEATTSPGTPAGGVPLPPPTAVLPPPVDLAICLDTSGSMENLIESTKQHIWSVVNELALARPQPRLRVALLTFGNEAHSPDAGWVRVDTDLTDDLDLLSERLFALTTSGGTELVGRVLKRARDDLSWSREPGALKLVVVAGNESADQDREVRFADACAALIGDDILVNALYCGAPGHADALGWSAVARRADGRFFAIDTASAPAYVETPFDERLMELSRDLNETYIPIGDAGGRAWANQTAQDENARKMNGANGAGRAQVKAGANYVCAWDLVDVVARDESFDVAALEAADLPETMRKMTAAERRDFIAKMAQERARIQKLVAEASRQRAEFVAAETAKSAHAGQHTFATALLSAIRDQAAAKGFHFVE